MSCWLPGPKFIAVELVVCIFFFSTVNHAVSLPSWFHFFSVLPGGKPTSQLPHLNIASCLTTHQLPMFSTQCPHDMGNARESGVILEILCAWPCHPVLLNEPGCPHGSLGYPPQQVPGGEVWQESTALIITIIHQTYCFPLDRNWKKEVWIQHLTSQKH